MRQCKIMMQDGTNLLVKTDVDSLVSLFEKAIEENWMAVKLVDSEDRIIAVNPRMVLAIREAGEWRARSL